MYKLFFSVTLNENLSIRKKIVIDIHMFFFIYMSNLGKKNLQIHFKNNYLSKLPKHLKFISKINCVFEPH